MKIRIFSISLLAFQFMLIPLQGFAWSISSGSLVEDFTTISQWDAAQSTGLWNIVDHAIQAGRVTGGVATRSLSFGDGSDGAVTSDSGYEFDTDSHPNGYQFISLNIRSGTITVRGTSPLIIRSLSTITLVPTLSVKGSTGITGTANGSTSGPAGGSAIAGKCDGGKGGDATGSGNGGDGKTYSGATEVGGGAGGTGGTDGSDGASGADLAGARNTWETSPNFRCGAGGAGGGSHVNGGIYATGGSGGAGGSAVRLLAVGEITYGIIDASGGDGGLGVNDGSKKSGGGGGGNGGAIWLQSLKTSTGTSLLVSGGRNAVLTSYSGSAFSGYTRTDSATTSDAGQFSTGDVAASQTYIVQSKGYDLGTSNAGFFSQPTLGTTLNNGTIRLTYQGSSDGTQYSDATSDITTLSNRGFRYIKFKATLQTASTVGASPQLTSINIPFSELNIHLTGGCGSTSREGGGTINWLLVLVFAFFCVGHSKAKYVLEIPMT